MKTSGQNDVYGRFLENVLQKNCIIGASSAKLVYTGAKIYQFIGAFGKMYTLVAQTGCHKIMAKWEEFVTGLEFLRERQIPHACYRNFIVYTFQNTSKNRINCKINVEKCL